MRSTILQTADALSDLFDGLRALYGARGLGVESFTGLFEAARRAAAGDLSPAALWSLQAADTPDKPALVQGQRTVTWSTANARINRLANALCAIRVEPGDRVAIMLGNSVEWFEAVAACQKIGAATVFVSYRYAAPELRYLLEDSEAVALFFDEENRELVRKAKLELVDDGSAIEVGSGRPSEFEPYEIFLLRGAEDEPPARARRAGNRTILYTSGTTGKPKGAVRDLSKAGVAPLVGLLRRIPLRGSDRHLVAAPLYHATASGFASLHLGLGATVAILEKFSNFDEALDTVNDSDFGLQAGIFTDSLAHAHQAWDRLEVGGVVINDVPSFRVDNMPYGGVKDSGLGREGIRYAIEDMTEARLMVMRETW